MYRRNISVYGKFGCAYEFFLQIFEGMKGPFEISCKAPSSLGDVARVKKHESEDPTCLWTFGKTSWSEEEDTLNYIFAWKRVKLWS